MIAMALKIAKGDEIERNRLAWEQILRLHALFWVEKARLIALA
jgi:hypothetical protein